MSIIPPGGQNHPPVTDGEITAGNSGDEKRSYSVDEIVELIVAHTPGAGGGDFTITPRADDTDESLTSTENNTITSSDVGASTITKTLPPLGVATRGKVFAFRVNSISGGSLVVQREGATAMIESGGDVTSYTMTGDGDYVCFLGLDVADRWAVFASSAGGTVTSLSGVEQNRIIGRISSGTGASEKLTATQVFTILGVTAFAQTILDDATAGAALTTLGVTTFAQTLTDDADAATARTTLGVDAAGFVSAVAQDRILGRISSGEGTNEELTAAQVFTILGVTAFAQTILDDATAGAALTTLGVTTFAQTLTDDADAATARTTLGVDAAGFVSAVAQDRILGRISSGEGTNEELTAAQVFTILGVTAFAQTLLDDATAGAARTTLGVSTQIATDLAAGPAVVDASLSGGTVWVEGTITGVDIECDTGNYFEYALSSGTFTPTLSSIPASPDLYILRLKLTYTGGTFAYTNFTNLEHDGGSAPSLTTSRTYYMDFLTSDAGANWEMMIAGECY